MKRDYRLYLEDIKNSIKDIEDYMKNISEENFKNNKQLQDAVVRKLEIIGEASRNIPRALKEKNKNVPWESMQQFRDLLTHCYFQISLNRIIKFTKEDILIIKSGMQNIKLV